MLNHENLKGRVAVVTGGGGVLGRGFAKDLAARGVKVAVLNRSIETSRAVADEIRSQGGQALALSCDVLVKEELENARRQINEEFGTCDILINGAGGNSPLGNTTKETFELEDISEKA